MDNDKLNTAIELLKDLYTESLIPGNWNESQTTDIGEALSNLERWIDYPTTIQRIEKVLSEEEKRKRAETIFNLT